MADYAFIGVYDELQVSELPRDYVKVTEGIPKAKLLSSVPSCKAEL
jgi:hypothetical protein